MLLQSGADATAKDKDGRTAFDLVSLQHEEFMVDLAPARQRPTF